MSSTVELIKISSDVVAIQGCHCPVVFKEVLKKQFSLETDHVWHDTVSISPTELSVQMTFAHLTGSVSPK